MGWLARQDGYDPDAFDVPGEQSTNVPGALLNAGNWFLRQAAKPEAEAQADVRNVIGALAAPVMVPGQMMKPNPYPPGSEEAAFYDAKKLETATTWAPEMALNLAGTGMPFAEKNAAGVFGGRLAKTADLNALAKAEEMAAKAAPADDIWKQTGWFQGADKKWKFEIPDQLTHWKTGDPAGLQSAGEPVALGDKFYHPELYKAYPELYGVDLNVSGRQGVGGSYQSGSGLDAPTINLSPQAPGRMRSVVLHEIQHGIQDIEGFAAGGNTIGMSDDAFKIYKERLKAIHTPATEAELAKRGVIGPDYPYSEYLKQHKQSIKNPKSYQMLDRAAQDYAVQEAYKRLAGEVEARNVQRRMDFDAAGREQIPLEGQAYPNEQQIVKFGNTGGPQMSIEKPPGIRAYHSSLAAAPAGMSALAAQDRYE
jgi:hypothetical protein